MPRCAKLIRLCAKDLPQLQFARAQDKSALLHASWPIYVRTVMHACMWHDVMHACVWRDSFMHVTWPIYVRTVMHACMWHDVMHACVWHDLFMHVTWPIYVSTVMHACMWHDSFTYVTWHIPILAIICHSSSLRALHWGPHCYMRHDAFMYGTWLVHVCNIPHTLTWRDSLICVQWLFHVFDMTCLISCLRTYTAFICMPCLMHVCNMTYLYARNLFDWYVCHDAFMCVPYQNQKNPQKNHSCDMTHS